jgi:hypothetical protein
MREHLERLDYGLHLLSEPIADRSLVDEFACSGISGPADVARIFTRSPSMRASTRAQQSSARSSPRTSATGTCPTCGAR